MPTMSGLVFTADTGIEIDDVITFEKDRPPISVVSVDTAASAAMVDATPAEKAAESVPPGVMTASTVTVETPAGTSTV